MAEKLSLFTEQGEDIIVKKINPFPFFLVQHKNLKS